MRLSMVPPFQVPSQIEGVWPHMVSAAAPRTPARTTNATRTAKYVLRMISVKRRGGVRIRGASCCTSPSVKRGVRLSRRMESSRLASLTADELLYAADAVKRSLAPARLTFYEISLREVASTEQKRRFFAGDGDAALPARRAHVVLSDPEQRRVLVGHAPVDSYSADQRVVVRERSNVQPPLTAAEYALCERIIIEHEPFRAACRARSVDATDVRVDTWCVGWHDAADDPTRRLVEPILYVQRGDDAFDTCYCQPLEGFTIRIDLWAALGPSIISFEVDAKAPPPPPPSRAMRFPDTLGEATRPPLKPLSTSQPDGAGFELHADGTFLWQHWSGVLSFSSREGLILNALRFHGRPVAWRLSFSEMCVPYADPYPPNHRKAAFDAGEDGLGRNAHSLNPNRCDCAPGAALKFLDAHLVTDDGGLETIANAVCVHEEDGGLLWKHLDWRTGSSVARRNRKLVAMFLCTIANYTYAFAFKLGLDGEVMFEATLTGILSIGCLPQGVPSRRCGQTLDAATGLYGPDHQHIFVARIDAAVDGLTNRVVEVDFEPMGLTEKDETEEDVYARTHGMRHAFKRRATVLATERDASRSAKPQVGRHWLIQSCERVNGVGEPTAWKLEPGSGSAVAPACMPSAAYLDRASFLHSNVWVTQYHPDERFPGGDFPNQRPPSMPDGLHHWTATRDAGLDGVDLVLWHCFGLTHAVRLEDAPVMPCERVSFCLKPDGFFDASPCVDVPCGRAGCASKL